MAEARRIAEEEATEARREAAEERRRERDYRRLRKAQEAEASTARQLAAEAGTGPPIHTTCNCHRDDWCTCGAARIAEEHLPSTHATTALDMTSAPLQLCTELNINMDRLEEAWWAYRATKSKPAQPRR